MASRELTSHPLTRPPHIKQPIESKKAKAKEEEEKEVFISPPLSMSRSLLPDQSVKQMK
jgi:hypothetical protein